MAELRDILRSGDIKEILTDDINIVHGMKWVDFENRNLGTKFTMGKEGLIALTKEPITEIRWLNNKSIDTPVPITVTDYLAVVPGKLVDTDHGSYGHYLHLENPTAGNITVTVKLYDNITQIGSDNVIIVEAGDLDKQVLLTGGLDNAIQSGNTVKSTIQASATGVTIKGTTHESVLRISKARVAGGSIFGSFKAEDNTTATSIAAQDVWYKATLGALVQTTAYNTMIVDGSNDVVIPIRGTFEITAELGLLGTGNDVFKISFWKNGSRVSEAPSIPRKMSITDTGALALSTVLDFEPGDTIGIAVMNTDGTSNITVADISLHAIIMKEN